MTNGVLAAATPLVLTAGLVLAGWLSIWAIYAWVARDGLWIVTYGSVTLLALGLPVVFVGWYDRWQVRHDVHAEAPDAGTRTSSWACGLFATLLTLAGLPLVALCAYLAWGSWHDGAPAASLYFGVVALATLAQPVGFLHYYDRWRARNGIDRAR